MSNEFIERIRDQAGLNNTGNYISPSWASDHPEAAQGLLTRQQYDDYVARYQPIETEVLDRVSQNGEAEADAAGARAMTQAAITRREFMAKYAGTGATMSPEARAAAERKLGLARALSVANAENTTRRNIESRNLDVQGDMIGIGKNITAGASSGLSTAASLQSQRNATADAIRTNNTNQRLSSVATGAGIGWMAGAQAGATVGGPWGAAIGAGAGLLASMI